MSSLAVLYGGNLNKYAAEKLCGKMSSVEEAFKKASAFPCCKKILIVTTPSDYKIIADIINGISSDTDFEILPLEEFTASNIFKAAADCGNFENAVFAKLDEPLIDLNITGKLYEQHIRYKAEYTFGNGYPDGLLPEILNAGLCRILSEIEKENKTPAARNFIFETIKKDINSYDIETMIAPEDVRYLRLNFAADSKRNKILCENFSDIDAENYSQKIKERAEYLKTLPRYFMIEIADYYPLNSIYKPPFDTQNKIMSKEDFFKLTKSISEFCDDAVISLSVHGEPAFHPDIEELAENVLSYSGFSLLIETSGLGWKKSSMEKLKQLIEKAPPRSVPFPPLFWITCIDALSAETYSLVHNLSEEAAAEKLEEANEVAENARQLFGNNSWVQTFRMNENEKDLEPFYRFWKDKNVQVIIQKYNHFCKLLPDRRVADLSPLERQTCRHLMRDVTIFTDGNIPVCREDVLRKNILGNAFTQPLDEIWRCLDKKYKEHLKNCFGGLCESCDEYYTYNF